MIGLFIKALAKGEYRVCATDNSQVKFIYKI